MSKKDPYAALRFKEFNLFMVVRFMLVFGWTMQFMLIEWEVYKLTHDALYIGLIGLMEIIPAFAMALFAGHIVDQNEKRNLLLKCVLAFIGLSIGLFIVTLPNVIEQRSTAFILGCMYVLVFLGGIVRSFIGPTVFSLIAQLVPKKAYPNAATWSSSMWQLASVIGPAAAGVCIALMGVNSSMLVVIAAGVISTISLLLIEKKPILNKNIGEPMMESLKQGLQFVFKSKAILGAITLDMVAVLFGGAIALLPVYAQDILKVGPEGYGILRAAPAVGALLTVVITAYLPIAKNAGRKLLFAVFGFGLCIIGFGLSTVFWFSVVLLFLSGVTDGISVVIRQTILQLKAPENMRGRVSSVNSIFVGSSNELGAFESGVAAKMLGTVAAVTFGGIMTLVTVGFTAIVSPTFRNLDLEKDVKSHEED